MKKIVIWIVVIVLLALIGWRIFGLIKKAGTGEDKAKGKSASIVPVEISPVEIVNMQDIGSFSGSLKPRSGYSLASRVSGRLTNLQVRLGDKVSNGQLVAVLDDSVYQQELERARAELSVVQAQVEQTRLALKASEANYLAVKTLYEKDYETKAVMDQTEAEHASNQAKFDMAKAEVQRAQSMVKTAEIQLSYTQIRAVWNGVGNIRLVSELFINEGNIIAANAPILTLIDNNVLTAEIDVIERDYTRIKVGQPVTIQTDAYPEHPFPGVLARLSPVLQEASRQAKAEIDIPNPGGLLKPGMYVRVKIVYAEQKDVTAVPLVALVEREGKSGVFIADTAALTAKFVPLVLGIRDETKAEVLDPPLTGNVIILGQELLQDGGKIQLPQPKDKESKGKGERGAGQ